MILNPCELSPNAIYHLMTQLVIPRPIAWVLTENSGGNFNLAPFSYFNAVSSDPPLLMLSIVAKPDGDEKDTLRNIRERQQLVIHIPGHESMATVNASSEAFAYGESEISTLNIPLKDFDGFSLPRISDCAVALGCTLDEIIRKGDGLEGIVFVRVEQIFVEDQCMTKDKKNRPVIDPLKLNPLARLGLGQYATLGKVY